MAWNYRIVLTILLISALGMAGCTAPSPAPAGTPVPPVTAATTVSGTPSTVSWPATATWPSLETPATGHPYSKTYTFQGTGTYEDFTFTTTSDALWAGLPVLAICRGHQLLNVALGGTLVLDIRSQLPGALEHRRTDKRSEVVHEVRLTPDSLLAKITTRQQLGVNSTHHQAVGRVAPPLRVVAASQDGIIEGVELKPGVAPWMPFLLSVQFHPERLVDRYPEHRRIFRAFARACLRQSVDNL